MSDTLAIGAPACLGRVAYEREANDFYPTRSDLAFSLALGSPRLGS